MKCGNLLHALADAGAAVCVGAFVCAETLTAAEAPSGVRVRGRLHLTNRANNCAPWLVVDNSTANWTDSGNAYMVFDVGTPRTLTGLGMYPRNENNTTVRGRALNMKVYGSNDTNNYTATLLFDSGSKYSATETYYPLGVTTWLDPKTELAPYRYYRITGNSCPNYHLLFYSNDPQVTQDCRVWDSSKCACDDLSGGPRFTGTVVCLPDGGTADVRLMVAKTDHGDDYAAWAADSSCETFSSSYLAQDATYEIQAPVAAGRWFGRVFLAYGGKTYASQATSPFVAGTTAYLPAAYFAAGRGSTQYVNYDGSLSTRTDDNTSPQRVFFTPDDIDREIVAIRIWPRSDVSLRTRILNARFCASASDGDFGTVTDVKTVSGHVIRECEQEPTSDWTQFVWLCDQDLWSSAAISYLEIPASLPFRHTKYLRFDNYSNCSFFDIEFRTLPRPATPEAAMTLGTPGGSYVGLSGYLDYRGNGATSCDVYVSCVKTGAAPTYSRIATGWLNETEWSGTVSKLSPQTDYEIRVIVSNEIAGVEALRTTFTTTEAANEPPEVQFTSVTPNADGTVTFSWNTVMLGTDGNSADVFVRWGADEPSLGARVKIATVTDTGAASATCSSVPLGTNLVFTLVAVNDRESESEETDAIAATIPGPSAFESASVVQSSSFGLSASGKLSVRGLGTTYVYVNWGTTEGTYDRWSQIASISPSDASSAFSSTVSVDETPVVWARLVASNAMSGYTWLVPTTASSVLLGTMLPANYTSPYNILSFVMKLHNGVAESELADFKIPLTLDFGSPHALGGVRYALRASAWRELTGSLSFWTSLDGETWSCAWSNETGQVISGGVFHNVVMPAGWPKVRFLKATVKNPSSSNTDFTELAAYAMDTVLSADQIRCWGSGGTAAAAHHERYEPVWFSGQVLFGEDVHVYGCYSSWDFREDLESWRRAGTVVDLGVHSAGGTFSGTAPAPSLPGIFRARILAVKGDEVAASPQADWPVLGTRVHAGPMYVRAAVVDKLSMVYDGNVSSCLDSIAEEPVYFKLDPKRWRAVGVRYWPRNNEYGCLGRPASMRVEATTDATEVVSAEYRATPRAIRTFESCPLTGFTRVGDMTYRSDVWEQSGTWSIPLRDMPSGATWLRIYGGQLNNYREVEVRVVPVSGTMLTVR